ncbi:MAG: ROK family protein, partial [Candidatus Korobacteraceae bacterium]
HSETVRDLVVVTVSEGVGAGVFINGQLVLGKNAMAGEFGHVPLSLDGPICTCGRQGCWEEYASHRAAERYYRELNPSAESRSFRQLLAMAEGGDPLALEAMDKMARAVGRGVRVIATGLAPEEIVVVGEFTRLWSRLGPIIEKEVACALLPGRPPRVRAVADPRTARLRGTVALVLQKHFSAFSSKIEPPSTSAQAASGNIAVMYASSSADD